MYTGAKTIVRTVYGNNSGFEVKVVLHQRSALSPLLFVAISREFRVVIPGSILSVESNQNMESKTKNVESKTEKCGVQNSIFTSRNQLF